MTLTNAQLTTTIKSGRATDAQRREYERRVNNRRESPDCEYGHFGCALVEGGPCANEAVAALVAAEDDAKGAR